MSASSFSWRIMQCSGTPLNVLTAAKSRGTWISSPQLLAITLQYVIKRKLHTEVVPSEAQKMQSFLQRNMNHFIERG